MTAEAALALVEDELQTLDCHEDVWTALLTLRHSITEAQKTVVASVAKPRAVRKPKQHPAVKACANPVGVGHCLSYGWGGRKEALRKWQEAEYAAATSNETLKRVKSLPRSPQFDYDPPAKMKDDERMALIGALLSSSRSLH